MIKKFLLVMCTMTGFLFAQNEFDISSQVGRYQLVVSGDVHHYIYVLDTENGTVWMTRHSGFHCQPWIQLPFLPLPITTKNLTN